MVPKSIKVAMFDFDGTLTAKGVWTPNIETCRKLVALAHKMPVAVCTGRQLEAFENDGMNYIFAGCEDEKELEVVKQNFYLIAENGSLGYHFDIESDSFVEFYRTPWPEEFVAKAEFKIELRRRILGWAEIYEDCHRVIVVVRPDYGDDLGHEEGRKRVAESSERLAKVIEEILREIDPNFLKHLHIGNSGIGVVVCPADGDKDEGIRRFGDFLYSRKGFDFDVHYRDIMVVGDSPQPGGNDFYFLNGRYGTAYNVGHQDLTTNSMPYSVYDSSGKRLFNDVATRFLIENLLKQS